MNRLIESRRTMPALMFAFSVGAALFVAAINDGPLSHLVSMVGGILAGLQLRRLYSGGN